MRSAALPILLSAALAACDAGVLPTGSEPESPPSLAVYHWPTGGNTGFYFLPSDAPPGFTRGTFDPALSPVVEICRVTNEECGPVLASFGMSAGSYGRRVTLDAAGESYDVSWPTGSTGASAGQVYRVTVRVGERVLGYEDVFMVTTVWQLFTTDRTQYRPWVAGWTLPISFRIDQGVVGSIVLSAGSLALDVGDGLPVSAQVLDLHGNPLARPLQWRAINTSAAAGAVAVVDSGLVIGAQPGTSMVFTWTEDILASIPVTVTDTRHLWSEQTTPDDQGIRALWGSSPSNVFAASYVGVLRWNGSAWAHEDAVRWRNLHALTGTPGGGVWAVGEDGIIVRLEGSEWTGFRFDGSSVAPHSLGAWDSPARRIALRALWSPAPGQLVAVGDSGTALLYDGSGWNVVPTGQTVALTDVWGSGPTSVYATTADGRLLRFNGASVAAVPGVQAPGALHAVWGSGANDVYAVGAGGLVFHFDGSSWERIRLPTRVELYAVWGRSASEVYVGGQDGTVYRYDGARWTPERGAAGSQQVYAFWGAPGGEVLAAGATGLISRR